MNYRRALRWLLLPLAILFVSFVAGAWFVGGRLVSPANRTLGLPQTDLPIESVTIESKSGSSLAAWYIQAEEAHATVILLHPLHGDRRSMMSRAKLLHDAGYSTLLVDLQSHGESIGPAITFGFNERHDVRAALEFVKARNADHRVGIIGWSLGGAATLLALPLEIDAVVLESVYPEISQAVHNRISMRLGSLHHVFAPALLIQMKARLGISPTQLRPVDCIDKLNCPVLVAAGDLDRHTTFTETQQLFDAAVEPKQLVVFEGAAHTDLLAHDPSRYTIEIIGFLESHLKSHTDRELK